LCDFHTARDVEVDVCVGLDISTCFSKTQKGRILMRPCDVEMRDDASGRATRNRQRMEA
jgi:hypothetical protein